MKSLNELHRILIAVEDSQYSDRAASYGFDLARKLGAEVALIHVNEIPVATPYLADPLVNEAPVVMPEMITAQEDASKRLLDRIADAYGSEMTVYTFNKMGSVRDEILSTAEEWNADLIILGTHGRTGFDHFISGSVAEKVVQKARCPVLIIPNKDSEHH
ncbi:universal stress protein [Pedobacter sp. SYSU D00535]|uniref:universal stress protein n=1 Tax=Pedobacter sp. SYSU D00535 TaxID=2810308 RepID=UPI001A978DA8|nr:universal stress protein [Pedobacter sp. SYSU D00535]